MSRRGNCWDNAVAESFFATLKRECIYLLDPRSRRSLRKVVEEYIAWYNETRLHSAIGYRSPAEFEANEFGILGD
jgi:transposase InsO family protein